MLLTATDFELATCRATHGCLVRLHNELTVNIILQWLRDNRSHPKAGAVDTLVTLYRRQGNLQDLRDADEFVTTTNERTAP